MTPKPTRPLSNIAQPHPNNQAQLARSERSQRTSQASTTTGGKTTGKTQFREGVENYKQLLMNENWVIEFSIIYNN